MNFMVLNRRQRDALIVGLTVAFTLIVLAPSVLSAAMNIITLLLGLF